VREAFWLNYKHIVHQCCGFQQPSCTNDIRLLFFVIGVPWFWCHLEGLFAATTSKLLIMPDRHD
jgi:hypothetical protein